MAKIIDEEIIKTIATDVSMDTHPVAVLTKTSVPSSAVHNISTALLADVAPKVCSRASSKAFRIVSASEQAGDREKRQ